MTIADVRGDRPCLAPVRLDHLVDDPEAVLDLAHRSGPYTFPERPGGFIWPTWHSRWATHEELLVEEAAPLLHHAGLISAAAQMCGVDTAAVVPEGLYVNLGTPWIAQPVMHTDLPLFRGIDHETVPGWFLQSMGASRLFEEARVNSITAVTWFFNGTDGGFTCWPDGPSGDPLEQTDMWNTAIAGDNDFMYHRVERIGPDGTTSPDGMTAASTLDHDGTSWVVLDDGRELGRFANDEVRLSVSWKSTIHDENTAEVSLDDAFDRLSAAYGFGFAAANPGELFDEPSRVQLMERWPGFLPV